jgi:predicted MFS family arabinose efflux permease
MKESTLTQYVYGFGTLSLLSFSYVLLYLEDFYYYALGFHFLIGIFAGLQFIRYVYMIQTHCDKKYLGRIMSITDLVFAFAAILGMTLGAIFNEIFTYQYGFLITATIYFIGFFVMTYYKRRVKF